MRSSGLVMDPQEKKKDFGMSDNNYPASFLQTNFVVPPARAYLDESANESRKNSHILVEEHNSHSRNSWYKYQFTILVILMQALFMVLMGIFGKYQGTTKPEGNVDMDEANSMYPMFQDVHVMIFAGFGFLMTFLKRYGYSAVSINLLLASMTIEWGIVVRGLINEGRLDKGMFTVNLESLLDGDFCAATILITMGAMLGKLSPTQYLIMAFLEVPAAMGIGYIVTGILKVNDVGDSLTIHCFGAYFGMACSVFFQKKTQREHPHEGSSYNSDIFSMIGTIFLWCFWPSFNAATASPADAKLRAVANTYLSLVASTVATFVISQVTDKHRKFDMMHIANATLAGGVAIGTNANSVLNPVDAMIIGVVSGTISTLGFRYLTPLLSRLGIHDTCGVNNLHGMPSIISGLSASVFAVRYNILDYGTSVAEIYPAIKKKANGEWDASHVALYQFYGLLIVFGAGLAAGAITGLVLRLPIWEQVDDENNFSDDQYFETPGDFKESNSADLLA